MISFEVGDQTPEDLAVGLDALREHDGVLDVVQIPALGKKGRMMMSVRVLCRPETLGRVSDACFMQTTTIGLRWRTTMRSVPPRRSVAGVGRDGAVKIVERPGGRRTAKADIDPSKSKGDSAPERRRRQAEDEALERGDDG